MYQTQRTSNSITSTLVPSSQLTPPLTPDSVESVPTPLPEQASRGWYGGGRVPVRRGTPLTRRNKQPLLPTPVFQPPVDPYGYCTVPDRPCGYSTAPVNESGYFTYGYYSWPSDNYGYFTAPPTTFSPQVTRDNKRQRDPEQLEESRKQKIAARSFPMPSKAEATASPPPTFDSVNAKDLFAKLVATGIIPESKEANTIEKEVNAEQVGVDLLDRDSLRIKRPHVVDQLYSGKQCSGCSLRFQPKQTEKYSRHLDWHFHQNRRQRERTESQPWYYVRADWLQSEEMDDAEKKEKNWFETSGLLKKPPSTKAEAVPSVVAGAVADDYCAVCGDKFDLFYNDEDGEWHLKNSVRNDDKNCHPLCLEYCKVTK